MVTWSLEAATAAALASEFKVGFPKLGPKPATTTDFERVWEAESPKEDEIVVAMMSQAK